MKKLLISILIILLLVLGYFAFFTGISMGKFKILGISGIRQANEKIDTKINTASKLTNTDFPKKISDINVNAKELLKAKEDYMDLTNYSSTGDIAQANELPSYEMEYLWGKIGGHATKEGIKLDMNITTASTPTAIDGRKLYDISFTADGAYIGIALFISALENDSFLEFKIENFKMLPAQSSLRATFTVRNVPIKLNNLASQNSATTTNEGQNTNNTTNTNNATTNTQTNQTNTAANTTGTTNTTNVNAIQ